MSTSQILASLCFFTALASASISTLSGPFHRPLAEESSSQVSCPYFFFPTRKPEGGPCCLENKVLRLHKSVYLKVVLKVWPPDGSISMTWGLVRNAEFHGSTPYLPSQKSWGWGPALEPVLQVLLILAKAQEPVAYLQCLCYLPC